MTRFGLPAWLRLGPTGARRLRMRLALADRAMAAGDWPAAEAGYAAVLALDPTRAAAAVQWGHALKEQGFLGRAEAAYRRALRHHSDGADTLLQLGHVLKLQGRATEALAAYAQAYDRAPDEVSAREIVALGGVPLAVPRRPASARALRARAEAAAPRPPSDERFLAAVYGAGHPPPDAPRSLPDLLAQADLPDAFLRLFDEAFYADLADVRAMLPAPNRMRCLVHFCEVGLAAVLPINADQVFDAAFYGATALGGRVLAAAAAYRHWLTIGLARQDAANPADLLRLRCGIGPRRAAALTPADRAAFVALAVGGGSWIAAFDALEAAGALCGAAPRAVALRGAFADRAARFCASGVPAERRLGALLAGRILGSRPGHPEATRLLAGAVLEAGAATEAAALHASLEGSAPQNPALVLGHAAALDAAGRPAAALSVLAAGKTRWPGDARLGRAFDGMTAASLDRAGRLATAQGLGGAVEAAAGSLAAAVAGVAALSEPSEVLPPRPIRAVALVGNRDLDQCRFYRIDGKLEQLAAAGLSATFFDYHTDVPRFLGALFRFDAVIFYRVPANAAVIAAAVRARAAGLLTIYEIDDLIFEAAHYPEPLSSYGGTIAAREHLGLRLGVPLIAAAMRLCDVGLASTPALAAHMAPFMRTGRARVHRNAMGSRHAAMAARPRSPREPGPVTIVYGSGTKAHATDFTALVEPALVELAQRHGRRLRIVLAGHVPDTPNLAGSGIVERHGPLPLEDYWAILAGADIALAVLQPSAMADAKSEIKWLEAAMLGVPAVVSATATFREVITPGIDGFLCATAEDWLATLDALVRDEALRERVGAAARRAAMERYGPTVASKNLAALLGALSPPAPPRRPKVLLVNVYYPPQAIGGATRVVHDNARALLEDGGFEVEVFCSTDAGETPYALTTYATDGVRVTAATIPRQEHIDRELDLPGMGAAFAGFLAANRPDLIHFHCVQRLTVAVVEAAQRAGIPTLITLHDGWWVSDEQFITDRLGQPALYDYADPVGSGRRLGAEAARRMARLGPVLRGATRRLAVSRAFAALHARCGVEDVLALPNGVSGVIGPVRAPSTQARVRLGFVAGRHAHKGWRLIETVLGQGAFDGLELVAIDDEIEPGETLALAIGTTPVTFVAKVPAAAMGALYATFDVLLAPSIWPESFGLATREALACGCWVVASDRGAIGEDVVEGANGFVIDVAGPEGLAAALAAIAADPDRYRRPPAWRAPLRTAAEQGQELAALYRAIVGTPA